MTRRALLMLLVVLVCGVSAAVADPCKITLPTTLAFGTYTSTQLDGTSSPLGTVGGNGCPGKSWDIPLDQGTGAGATVSSRKMTGPGGNTLSYGLFLDVARSINWGSTSTTDLAGTGNATFYVYGRILAGQYVAPGTYTDTISSTMGSFTVTATISATCTVAATALGFGNYLGAVLNSTSTITVNCTNLTAYNLGLDAGTGSGATVTTRKMTGPSSSTLGYSLFSNSGYTIKWGNTVGTDTVPGTGNGTAQLFTVYGQIPAGQYVTPGNYTDTITVTLSY